MNNWDSIKLNDLTYVLERAESWQTVSDAFDIHGLPSQPAKSDFKYNKWRWCNGMIACSRLRADDIGYIKVLLNSAIYTDSKVKIMKTHEPTALGDLYLSLNKAETWEQVEDVVTMFPLPAMPYSRDEKDMWLWCNPFVNADEHRALEDLQEFKNRLTSRIYYN